MCGYSQLMLEALRMVASPSQVGANLLQSAFPNGQPAIMRKWDTVAVVGVGLIGGSVGLALQQRGLARAVVGVGRRKSSLSQAKRRGAVTSTTTNLQRGTADAELIVICTPVADIVPRALEIAEYCPDGAVLTDVGSTKAEIVAALDQHLAGSQVAFVGSHPLAGSEKSGPRNARHDLFVDRVVVVTKSRRTVEAACKQVATLWQSLGAKVLLQSPSEHDQAVASISHMPHLVASALAAATPDRDLPLAATGWLDTTRIAGADVELWRQILSDNRHNVLKSLERLEKVLSSFRKALDTDDQKKLLQLLEAGKRNRESVGN